MHQHLLISAPQGSKIVVTDYCGTVVTTVPVKANGARKAAHNPTVRGTAVHRIDYAGRRRPRPGFRDHVGHDHEVTP